MSLDSATGSAAPSIQKWVIDSDVENQLRSGALRTRLKDKSLSHGSIELHWRCSNLTLNEWRENPPLAMCPSLLRVDLSGCPKLKSIPFGTFAVCTHLVSIVFGEHSNITNLDKRAFQDCSALTSITLPNNLKIIEQQKPQNYRQCRIPTLLQARRCPACIQFDFLRR